MPYLKSDIKEILDCDPMQAKNAGDYNYLYTIAYLKEFLKNPRYITIASIREASISPRMVESVAALEENLRELGVSVLEREVARELAFMEFYRRIGVMYEEFAIEKNGDVKEYLEAEELVNELMDKYYESL